MKNRTRKLTAIIVAIVSIIASSSLLNVETASADDGSLMNNCIEVLDIAHNPCKRAKVKAMFKALAHCTYVTDTVDNLTIGWALTGKWGADGVGTTNGEPWSGIGENLYDHFVNDVRNMTNKQFENAGTTLEVGEEFDCTENELIKEAFNVFSQYSDKDGKSWSEIVSGGEGDEWEERKKLFCDSGWFHAMHDDFGANSEKDCREAVDAVKDLSPGSDTSLGYALMADDDYTTRVNNLKNYINNNYFKDWQITDLDYTEDERFYLYTSLVTSYCSDGKGYQNLSDDATTVSDSDGTVFIGFDWSDSSDELRFSKKFAEVNTKHFNAHWYKGSYTASNDEDCNNNGQINAQLESLDKSNVKAAKKSLIDGLKLLCKKNYTDYYDQQTEYFNSLSDEQKKGDKKDYVEWYKKLPTEAPEDGECYEENDKTNPLFKCKMEEYTSQFSATNPDPDSPQYAGFSVDTEDIDTGETTTNDCYSNAGAVGWILCPIIENLADYIQEAYENTITPFLVLDADLFRQIDADGNVGGTYDAWRQFQSIANIAFIIIFLFVIFSQLTGYGIDNYGIKKILPKLIAAAILINASYIICQLVIDLANIVGYEIGAIFEGIGSKVSSVTIAESGAVSSEGWGIAIIVGLVIAITAGVILAMGPSVLVPIFLGLIAIAIGILGTFVILSVRKAMAVVLVAVSPLAFVCYTLPNMKPVFNKWLKAMQGVVIAFPICSALIYGGQAVARIIINANGGNMVFMMALSAAVISIIPVYFIPRVISRSMGAVSGTLNNLGRGIRGRAQNRFRNGNFAQDLNRQAQVTRDRRSAGLNRHGQPTRRKRIGDRIAGAVGLEDGRNRRIASARARYLGNLEENQKSEKYANDAKFAETTERRRAATEQSMMEQNIKDLESQIKLNTKSDDRLLEAGLKSALLSGNEDEIKAYTNILANKGGSSRDSVGKAYESAQKAGTISNEARNAFKQNIMDNHASAFKENSRSWYEFAKGNDANYTGGISYTQSLKGGQMNNMDDEEFARLQAQFNGHDDYGNSLTDEQRAQVRGAAYDALHSENAGNMKQERKQALEELSKGYKPEAVEKQEAAEQAARDANIAAINAQTEAITKAANEAASREEARIAAETARAQKAADAEKAAAEAERSRNAGKGLGNAGNLPF